MIYFTMCPGATMQELKFMHGIKKFNLFANINEILPLNRSGRMGTVIRRGHK